MKSKFAKSFYERDTIKMISKSGKSTCTHYLCFAKKSAEGNIIHHSRSQFIPSVKKHIERLKVL